MRHFSELNYVAVIVMSIVFFLIGFLWYAKSCFGKKWAEESGITMSPEKEPTWKMIFRYLGQFISSFIFTMGIGVILDLIKNHDLKVGILTGLFIIVFMIFPLNSTTYFFKNKPKLFFIETGYYAIGAILIGIVLSLWR